MRRLKRTIQKTTARLIASTCVLGLLAGLACGQALAQSNADAPAAKPASKTERAAQSPAPSKDRKRKAIAAQPLLTEQTSDVALLERQKPGNGIKEIAPGAGQGSTQRSGSARLAPEFRPAVDTLTPSDSIAREPKTYDRLTPGISAIIHPGKDTEIQGVFNLPEAKVGSMRPYGQPEGGAKSAASGGVMLKKSF
ncbi:hypothetical protein [Fundidesulfovibrio terrae]|uniref:hypothetical protein n=1 Tax=Fundidesulfovibrio terrae TaxID=2922866 RepID=UPI001FAF589C|nr:hypothetical protein [Fundidesulfovibrio terrae]